MASPNCQVLLEKGGIIPVLFKNYFREERKEEGGVREREREWQGGETSICFSVIYIFIG